jgi:hypothetical protein
MLFSKEIEDLRNYARLNAKSLSELYDLYVEIQKKIFGLDVVITDWNKLSFGKVANYWNCPINGVMNWCGQYKDRPVYYLGWSSPNMRGYYKNEVKLIDKDILNHFTFNKFDTIGFHSFQYGFNTGTFNGGEKFMGEFRLFIDDFPTIFENLPNLIPKSQFEAEFPNNSYDRLLRKIKLEKIFT